MGRPRVGVESTKGKSKNNRRSFDSFHALRETSVRMDDTLLCWGCEVIWVGCA
jgi:hypothetical protein